MRRLVKGLGVFSLGLGTAQLAAPRAMNRLIGADDTARNRMMQRWAGGAREFGAGVAIMSGRAPAACMWARVAGDMFDSAALAVLMTGPRQRPEERRRAALATAAVAPVVLADLIAAVALTLRHGAQNRAGADGIHTGGRITVNRPPREVYEHWHDLENLPRFMTHLESVRRVGGGRSRWRVTAPKGRTIEWDAEITDDLVGERIAWRSVDGAPVTHTGEVEFQAAPGGRGTEVRVRLTYDVPGGKAATAIAKLFGEAPDQQIRDDLRRFKQVLETGEVARSAGSPQGADSRRQLAQPPARPGPR